MQELVKKKEVNDTQCLKFKKDNFTFIYFLCWHSWKISIKSGFRPACQIFFPNVFSWESKYMWKKIIKRQITNSSAEDTKKELNECIEAVVNQKGATFMQYDKPSDDARLVEFYWKLLH